MTTNREIDDLIIDYILHGSQFDRNLRRVTGLSKRTIKEISDEVLNFTLDSSKILSKKKTKNIDKDYLMKKYTEEHYKYIAEDYYKKAKESIGKETREYFISKALESANKIKNEKVKNTLKADIYFSLAEFEEETDKKDYYTKVVYNFLAGGNVSLVKSLRKFSNILNSNPPLEERLELNYTKLKKAINRIRNLEEKIDKNEEGVNIINVIKVYFEEQESEESKDYLTVLTKVANKKGKLKTLKKAEEMIRASIELKTKRGISADFKDYYCLAECQRYISEFSRNRSEILRNLSLGFENYKNSLDLLRESDKTMKNKVGLIAYSCLKRTAKLKNIVETKREHLIEAIKILEECAGSKNLSLIYTEMGKCYFELMRIEKYIGPDNRNVEELALKAKEYFDRVSAFDKTEVYIYLKKISRLLKNPEKIGFKQPKDYLKDILSQYIIHNARWDVSLIGKSKNVVIQIDDQQINNLFVFKRGKAGDLEKEQKNAEKLETILNSEAGNLEYSVVIPITIQEHKEELEDLNGTYYVTEKRDGIQFNKFIQKYPKQIVYDEIQKIIDYLALIHARMPVNGTFKVEKGIEDAQRKIKRLQDLGMDTQFESEFIEVYNRILSESINGEDIVFKKDAHPGNWLIGNIGRVIAIDFEGGAAPRTYDLVKLVDYEDFFEKEEKEKLLKKYIESYKKYSGKELDFNNLKKQYMNMLIHKAIIDTRRSSKTSEYDNEVVENGLLKAENAIIELKQELPEKEKEYKILLDGVSRIRTFLREQYLSNS